MTGFDDPPPEIWEVLANFNVSRNCEVPAICSSRVGFSIDANTNMSMSHL